MLFAVVMLETGSLPLVAALHAMTNLVQDNVLRPSPDASLFTMAMRAPMAEGTDSRIWLALAIINLGGAMIVARVSRVKRRAR